MNKFALYGLLIIILSFGSSPLLSDGTWTEIKNEDGIKTLSRSVEGSPINEFMGVGIIDASLMEVNNVLDDLPQLASWMPNYRVSKLIERKSANHYFLYQELKTSFIASNRDFVTENIITITPSKINRKFKAVTHPDVPKNNGIVRITEMNGEWVLIKSGAKTQVHYRIRINPAGSIPMGLINSSSQDLPYKTLKGLEITIMNNRAPQK